MAFACTDYVSESVCLSRRYREQNNVLLTIKLFDLCCNDKTKIERNYGIVRLQGERRLDVAKLVKRKKHIIVRVKTKLDYLGILF